MASKEIRLLVLCDERKTAELIHRMVAEARQHTFVFDWKMDVPSAVASVLNGSPDLILFDYEHPGGELKELFCAVRDHKPSLPMMAITTEDGAMVSVELAKFGVQDHIQRDSFDSKLLVRSLLYARERKRFEQTLAREQTLLNELLSSTPDKIYFKDRNSRFLRVNKAFAEAYHFESPSELVGKSDFDIHRREHAQSAFADEQMIMQTGEPIISKDEKEIHLDDTVTWASSTKLPLRNQRGEIIGTMGISRDITKEKQTELALEQDRLLLNAILDSLPDNIFAKNRAGHYILSNPAHVKDLGAESEDAIIGKSAFDFFPKEIAEQFTEQDQRIIEAGKAVLNAEEFRPGQGEAQGRWLLTSKIPFESNSSDGLCLVGISRDITDIKATQEQLKETIDTLRNTQLQLIEAEKMKTVGRLAAGIAHEVKNPLNILSMGLDYIDKENSGAASDSEFHDVVEEMKSALNRASDVIHQLLDFSGPQSLTLEPTDVNEVIRRSINLLHHKILVERVEVITELSKDLPLAPLDVLKMEQVFINLVFNAVNAMPDGGKLFINSYTEKVLQSGQSSRKTFSDFFSVGDLALIIEFKDEGQGIPEDPLPKIFDPFFTTNETGKGTGLGLMVVKNIIDLHRGAIQVSNHEQGGVLVRLFLQTQSNYEN